MKPAAIRTTTRLMWAALRALLVLTVVTGVIYPLAVTGVAQTLFHSAANGSKVTVQGKDVGSALIGQSWNLPNGKPDPRWFQPRPSASDYDALSSGASNLAATSPKLVKEVNARKAEVAEFNGVSPDRVPPDAVTASASGLDPDISPEYARIQVNRVAKARHLPESRVAGLVSEHIQGRPLGVLGQQHVNVLRLNIALRALG